MLSRISSNPTASSWLGWATRAASSSQAASSRLETLAIESTALTPGASSFEPAMKGALGTQRVRRIEPGLYEVEIEVVHPDDDVRAVLTTRIAREPAP